MQCRYTEYPLAVSNKSILIVEDDDLDQEVELAALKRDFPAAVVYVAGDGSQAIDMLDSLTPKLILLDLHLPKKNGFEVLDRIRSIKRLARTPVVVLSSSPETAEIVRALESGANSYVRKPVEYDRFKQVLSEILHYWLKVHQYPAPIL